jgi:predicted metal-dependent hydrolase
VLAPAVVLRYVVIHELCHLRVPNHSRQFWRQLEAAVPGWQEQAAWLSEHGAELRAYRPEL